jgi:hypothetical protein
MPDVTSILLSLLILAAVGLLILFALGTQHNIRRGESFLKWLQGGLPVLGRRTTMRWLGSSAVELKIAEANTPFSTTETLIVLEPRDIGWLWAWSRSRGRRDFIILRGRLEQSPAFELEAGDAQGWTGTDRLKRLDLEAWQQETWGTVQVAHTTGADTAAVRRLWQEFDSITDGVWRLSVRRDNPHIEVHLLPPKREAGDARALFEKFRELGRAVTST